MGCVEIEGEGELGVKGGRHSQAWTFGILGLQQRCGRGVLGVVLLLLLVDVRGSRRAA